MLRELFIYWYARKQRKLEEQRKYETCHDCADQTCPARYSDVLRPCSHKQKQDD